MRVNDRGLGVVHIGHMAPRAPKAPHVAHFLREHREALGLTQEQVLVELAALLGKESMGKEQLSRWERGEKSPRPATLKGLATVYGVTVNDLYSPPRRRLPADQRSIDEMLLNAEADEKLWATARAVVEGLIRSR